MNVSPNSIQDVPSVFGETRALDGVQRVAALLLAMDRQSAGRVLKHFDQQELREVTRAAAQLGPISVSLLESLIEDFTTDFTTRANLVGDVALTRDLLAEALPADQVARVMNEALAPAEVDVWAQLAVRPEQEIAAYIARESALVVAYVVSKLDPALAGKVIGLLPRDLRNDVFCGLVAPPVITATAAKIVEEAVAEDLLPAVAGASSALHRNRLARLLNGLEPGEIEEVMLRLKSTRPKEAEALQSMLFSFNDLPKLSQRARAIVFDKIPVDLVVRALRGMDEDFRGVVLSSMASRSRRLVESELADGVTVPAREILKARRSIAEIVLSMAQRNEIDLPGSDQNVPDR